MGMAQSRINTEISTDDEDHPSAPPSPTTSISSAVIVTDECESDDEFEDCVNAELLMSASKPLESPTSSNATQQKNLISADSHGDDIDGTDDESLEERRDRQRKEMDEFREDMKQKREMRHAYIKKMREEMIDLREKLAAEMETNAKLRETLELHGSAGGKSFEEITDENRKLRVELAECQMFLQTSNEENINKTMETQALREHIRTLKEVIKMTKEMLNIRDCQVSQMKSKLMEIEQTFAEKETQMMSKALQEEYQQQLENIRKMRELYETRAELLAQERDMFKGKFEDKQHDLEAETAKTKKLEEYIATLENNVKLKNDDISHLEDEISILKSQKSQVTAEMTAVNQLIAQVVLGFNVSGCYVDIDKLVSMLEQNRDLLNVMAITEDYAGIDEGSFLPKLLFDIFLQANEPKTTTDEENPELDVLDNQQEMKNSPEEIAEKLPKVWRVLTELLSHQNELTNETDEEKILDNCYKTIQTASGATQNVLSVSKTFVKLKDLIMEKRSLLKDTGRLKTLYRHLEQRLDKQEKKLSSISLELMKTWHLVGKLKRQHRQLHTHEQILCYQMQQKRRVLNELKAELEYCRKKWALSKALTNDSEEQCKQLRHEFTQRKKQDQHSGESGYSDEHPSSDGDDDEVRPKTAAIAAMKSPRFDENLILFDRVASPTFLDRRQSESPVQEDFTNPSCPFMRAQSEPPQIPSTSSGSLTSAGMSESETESFEILDLIPDPVLESDNCIARTSAEEEIDERNLLVVSPPPEILTAEASSKLRAQWRRCKKETRRRERAKNGKKNAEDLFMELMMNNQERSECDTCSSTTVSIDEDEFENMDEIQEIPFDDVIEEAEAEDMLTVHDEALIVANDKAELKSGESLSQSHHGDIATTSTSSSSDKKDSDNFTEKEQEYLKRREERLQRLEAESRAFYDKMAKNRDKGQQLDNHLNEVHKNFLHRNRERTKSSDDESKKDESDVGRDGEPSTSKTAADADEDHNDDEMEQK